MPELSTTDVEQYTADRLHRDELETIRLLAAGLAAARRFCGWHVTPVRTDTGVTLDGPGGRLLALPTLRLVVDDDFAIVEEGVAVVTSDLWVSRRGLVQKKSGAAWTTRFGSITVTMTHGFDDAADFNSAVLSWIDRSSLAPAGGRANVIGPFQYPVEGVAAGSTFTQSERALLEQYRLERPA